MLAICFKVAIVAEHPLYLSVVLTVTMSDLHSPVPIFCSDFAEEEHSHHPSYVYCMPTEKLPYCNSVEGQSIAYFEATLTSPNFEETKNLPKLFCNLDPSISSTQASNSSPPTSSYLHGDMFPFLHGSAESSQFDGFTSYSSSLSDLHTAGIEEAQKPVGSNNEPVFPPALCIPSAKPHVNTTIECITNGQLQSSIDLLLSK